MKKSNSNKRGKKGTTNKKKVWKKVLLIMLFIILIAGSVFAYKVYKNGGGMSGMLATVVGHDENTKKNLGEFKCLILGISTDQENVDLTDTIMVASYNPNTQKATLLSIPRDTYTGKTPAKATAYEKINALYSRKHRPDETLEAVKKDMAESAKNLNLTILALGDLFSTLNEMAEGVKPNIVKSSQNINRTTENIIRVSENINDVSGNVASFSNNVNDTITSDRMDTTAKNVQAVSKNVKQITKELNNTIPQINCSIQQINKILCNIDEMTAGVNCTMKKPFGGMRMIFGSPVSKKKCDCQ